MLISKKNVKLQNDVFIDNIYDLYLTLYYNKSFENGYESNGFKIWKYDDEYYILNKNTGVLVTWHKLLGWNLESNVTLRDVDWQRFCVYLRQDLENNKVEIITPAILEEKDDIL